jgi:phage terminase small subunit
MLTDKQKLFCKEYLVDLNATQAAIRAGYSADSAAAIGSENLIKPEIQARVQELMDKRSKRTEITADRVLKELARIGFSDPRKVMAWNGETMVVKDSEELSEDDAACVSEVSSTTTKEGGSIKLKMHDKIAALDKLGKHLKLFTDVADVNHKYNIMGKIIAEPVGVQKPGQPTEAFELTFDIGSDPDNVIKPSNTEEEDDNE